MRGDRSDGTVMVDWGPLRGNSVVSISMSQIHIVFQLVHTFVCSCGGFMFSSVCVVFNGVSAEAYTGRGA